jgi:3-oxoacyl-[acyl-carrier protein] reductase
MNERKVALVTAAAGAGIGSAVVRRLAADDFDVVVTDIHEQRCAALADSLAKMYGRRFSWLPLDVTDYDAVGRVVKSVHQDHGSIDALVNNAGWNRLEPIESATLETWERALAVNLSGTFYTIRHVSPIMIAQGTGAIVNISSAAAHTIKAEEGAAYPAAKAGVLGLTRAAAAGLGPHGVRVNAVAPGFIYHEFLAKIFPKEFLDQYPGRTFLPNVGHPEDVAALVAFLLSDSAKYITGEVYGISGGEYANR